MLAFAIIVLIVAVGAVVADLQTRRELEQQAGGQSLAIAHAVAADPSVVSGISAADPAAVVAPIAERIRRATGASFIVVADRRGIRLSHPNRELIGTSLLGDPGEDPSAVLAGQTFVGQQAGSLGTSMRAKVPVRDGAGDVIGLVSVGVLEKRVSAELRARLAPILLPALLGLLLGTGGVLLLARRVKRQTFGLEPGEIAALLEQREAMLHGIREGAITLDNLGRLGLINDEAQRLLGLDRSSAGRVLSALLQPGRVLDVLAGRSGGRDEVIVFNGRVLLVNHMPVQIRGRPVGAVITVRDRTELEGLTRELDEVRALAEGLRAQEHEFANRLHVIGGLIELGRHDDAVALISHTSALHQQLAASLVEGVGDPTLSALLLGKAAMASERGVELTVSSAAELSEALEDPVGLVTVLGNLIDNAVEAAAQSQGGRVDVAIGCEGDDLVLQVHDSGEGVDFARREEIFHDGYTTKAVPEGRRRRGLGLALAHQEVVRRGGRIEVHNARGALFTVTVPLKKPGGTRQPVASS